MAIPCGLIANELITNALKHAFPEGRDGEINVCVTSEDDRFVMKVADNGIGFPKDIDFRSTQSLGLQLVKVLTKQMSGSFDMEVAGGTTFIVAFPGKKQEEQDYGRETNTCC